VATRAGSVKLEESTPRAGRLNKGGYVTVEIAIFGGTPPADRVRPVDPTLLRKRSTVDVVRVDRTAGTMRLIWPPSSTLTVDVPHEMLKRFKKGDRVPVELVVDLAPPPAASAPTESRRRGALATFILGILGKK
jgi:hypothetical protein